MPTGYTHRVQSGETTSLREFALTCARGMGALIMMRDEPLDAPVPERFEPDTKYYSDRLAEAEAKLAQLQAMSSAEREAAAAAHKSAAEARNAKRVAENDQQRRRYEDMIAKVQAWQGAPEGLKEFMLEQLVYSMKFDVSDEPYQEKILSAAEWYAAEVRNATNAIANATQNIAGEITRTEGRNAWLAKLHASLPAE